MSLSLRKELMVAKREKTTQGIIREGKSQETIWSAKDGRKVSWKVSSPDKRRRRAAVHSNMAISSLHLPSALVSFSPSQNRRSEYSICALFLVQNANDCCEGTGSLMTTKGKQYQCVCDCHLAQASIISRGKFTGVGSGIVEHLAVGWGGWGGYLGEAVDRLTVKDQSEKQRQKFKGAQGARQTDPAALLIMLRSINVFLFIYLFSYLVLKLFIAIIIWA